MPTSASPAQLRRTPLYDAHLALGAKMVPFAGYAMPVQYRLGVLKEHLWTRQSAGLFDVSHMGQALLKGPDHATVAAALEALVPADIRDLKPGRQRYSQFLGSTGGILDDLMVARPADPARQGELILVVNASRKEIDYRHIKASLPAGVAIEPQDDLALIALQGPKAARVLAALAPDTTAMAFMSVAATTIGGIPAQVSRSGYTGEDGFEISLLASRAADLWALLLADGDVSPIGLGARDSLRLEAGLCLYGHDIDETTSPVEAGLVWSMQRRRRQEGGFPGVDRIGEELKNGPRRLRVGIKPDGRAPAREGTEILSGGGKAVGKVTSGGFGPSVSGPIAMGYVETAFAAHGTPLQLMVRGNPLPAAVVPMPFYPHRYHR
jgi:aminomethyltransferase